MSHSLDPEVVEEILAKLSPEVREDMERSRREWESMRRVAHDMAMREAEEIFKDLPSFFDYPNTSGRPAIHWRDIKWPHK